MRASHQILINAVGIRGGGGWSVTRDLITAMADQRPQWRLVLYLYAPAYTQIPPTVFPANVEQRQVPVRDGLRNRRHWMNTILPQILRQESFHAYLDLTNMYSLKAPCPGVMFMQNLLLFNSFANNRKMLQSRWLYLDVWLRIWLQRQYAMNGIRKANYTIVQTENVRQSILRHLPNAEANVHVIPSGFTPHPQPPATLPDALTRIMGRRGPKIVYISHPMHYKNHGCLIEALAKIRAKVPDTELLLSIDPTAEHNRSIRRYINGLQSTAKRCGIDQAVHWIGRLTMGEVYAVLSRADLLVYPSLLESFGLPQVEAMSVGCPIAAADLPYAHDVCGEIAKYFDPYSPAGLADVVIRILTDDTLREKMRERGLERSQQFNYVEIARRFVSIFESLMPPGRPATDFP